MWRVLADATFRRLFAAQVVALVGTGLATVALGLLAYRLAAAHAGVVLGGVLAVRMVTNVVVAPWAAAVVARVARRPLLVGLDAVRVAAAVALLAADAVWQLFVLVAVLQAASAVFTPVFQATIPDVLPDEERYTQALSMSRVAYDAEAVVSPLLAAALLTWVSFGGLFAGTAVGFAASGLLVLSVLVPAAPASPPRRVGEDLLRGVRVYLATPRLRGLLALSLSAAAAGAVVVVNTVVYVQDVFGRGPAQVAVALGCYGLGSAAAAAALPRLLAGRGERPLMLTAGCLLAGTLVAVAGVAAVAASWPLLLVVWALLGAGGCVIVTSGSRLLRRSAGGADRTGVFAAQYALSHACWLLTYPLAGWLATAASLPATFAVCGLVSAAGAAAAWRLWPVPAPHVVAHVHRDLPAWHPHLVGATPHAGGWRHEHPFRIDGHHRSGNLAATGGR